MSHLVPQPALGLDTGRPAHDQRGGDSALVVEALVQPEGGVGHVRPRDPVALVRVVRARHDGRIEIADLDRLAVERVVTAHLLGTVEDVVVPAGRVDLLGASPVVRQEEDERIVEHAPLLELADDPPDVGVQDLDLGGVDLHAPELPRLVRLVLPGGHAMVPLRERPLRVDDPHGGLPLVARLSQLVPAHVEAPLRALDGVLGGVQGPVRGGERGVEEERLVRLLLQVIADEPGGVVTQRVRVVEARLHLVLGRIVAERERLGLEVAVRAVDVPEIPVEPTLQRPVVLLLHRLGVDEVGHVPFAARVGTVARALEHFRQGHALLVEVAPVTRQLGVVHHVAHTGLLRVQPRQQARARRTAASAVVEVREAKALARQPVDVRRTHLSTVARDVGEAHVVGEDEHDVGPLAVVTRSGAARQTREVGRARQAQRSVADSAQELPAVHGSTSVVFSRHRCHSSVGVTKKRNGAYCRASIPRRPPRRVSEHDEEPTCRSRLPSRAEATAVPRPST